MLQVEMNSKTAENVIFLEFSITFFAEYFLSCFFLPLDIVECLSLPDKKDEEVDINND